MSAFLDSLAAGGYFNLPPNFDGYSDELLSIVPDFPEELLPSAYACLVFARERPHLLELLSKRDIQVLVENGTPFLFRNGDESARRMRLFLSDGANNVFGMEKPNLVDLTRFLLSYLSNLSPPDTDSLWNKELVESSVRNLISELAKLSCGVPESNYSGSVQTPFPNRNGQTLRSFGQNIEMKRGDWYCPRCKFMNFARNMKCLECEEARPKRQLTGGEWECPQCDFFNYGRNKVCLRCDCKRPGDVSIGTTSFRSSLGFGDENNASGVDLSSRLAANEEKAQRWFSKVSQLNGTSNMNNSIADEDFPEIMPLRKGVNRFVVSTRKTPLERRLANAQYQRNLGDDNTAEGTNSQGDNVNETLKMKVSQTLDEILGSASASGRNAVTDSASVSNSDSQQFVSHNGSNSNYVPFVPLPADMFAKKPENSKTEEAKKETPLSDNSISVAAKIGGQTAAMTESKRDVNSGDNLQPSATPANQNEEKDEKEQAQKSERWFKRVAELHNVTDLASAISDEDFPEIMPMRKGENRFVVSKKKDWSLTSPAYKRRMAMEQGGNSNFVPFVPFPPDYFAKKDKELPESADSPSKAVDETSNSAIPDKLSEATHGPPCRDGVQQMGSQGTGSGSWKMQPSEISLNQNMKGTYDSQTRGNLTQSSFNLQTSGSSRWSREYSENGNMNEITHTAERSSSNSGYIQKEGREEMANSVGNPPQPSETENIRNTWSGKSLEGSAVKEPDPLDMSEEAKAERWFRRVAQIKDISELSQIPDEDFPSIMPMRKGVNRFVVSKRKTPLERRLTSQQYRRNLPIVSSDPANKQNDSNS